MPDKTAQTETKLWDEITKAIIHTMTPRILPVIKEAYGKEYPPGTSLTLLSTEHSTYLDNPEETPANRLMDIAILVAGTDCYHIECQMKNDRQMVIRMVAYDLHFALQHDLTQEAVTGEIILRFPQSFVIYPVQNDNIPDKLQCRLIFPDGNQYIYRIPTICIQTYSLKDIHEKHLDFFIPFTLLRFRPRLDSKTNKLTEKELTGFVKRLIVDLKKEVDAGVLTEMELNDYINLLHMASRHIFQKHPTYHKEVLKVTEPMIKLPSVQIRELQQVIAKNEETLAQNAEMLAQNAEILAQKDAIIAELERKLAALLSQ